MEVVQKLRDRNNKIIGYRLRDNNGETHSIKPSDLKSQIIQGKITVTNLRITQDGKLISISQKNKDRNPIIYI